MKRKSLNEMNMELCPRIEANLKRTEKEIMEEKQSEELKELANKFSLDKLRRNSDSEEIVNELCSLYMKKRERLIERHKLEKESFVSIGEKKC